MKKMSILLVIFIIKSVFANITFDEWYNSFRKIEKVHIKFEEKTFYKLLNRNASSKGDFYYLSPNKYKVITENSKILSDGKFIYNFDYSNKQIIIKNKSNYMNALELLLLDSTFLSFYNVTESKKLDKKKYEFVLTKTEDNSIAPFKTITIVINRKKQPIQIDFVDNNETETSIKIKKFDKNIKYDKYFFHYRRELGFEEIKMN